MTPVEALQTALEAEHAALYVYGWLGARTSQSRSPDLFAEISNGYATHRAWRDVLGRRLADQGATPAPAAATYELPDTPPTPAGVADAALAVEAACAQTYSYVVASTAGADRRWALDALTQSAVRAVSLGAAPEALPGADDLA